MDTERFDSRLYELIRPGCQASAAAVAPIVYHRVGPRDVIDVGCGEGWWGSEFAKLTGTFSVGVDVARPELVAPGVSFLEHDLTAPPPPGLPRFDLAVCLETAEHLPEEAAAPLVRWLCDLSDVVLFSAAIPGQTGAGHINEQWPAYWVALFEQNRYLVSGALRWLIWDLPEVEPWYKQNLLLACREPRALIVGAAHERPIAVVHPQLFEYLFELWKPRD